MYQKYLLGMHLKISMFEIYISFKKMCAKNASKIASNILFQLFVCEECIKVISVCAQYDFMQRNKQIFRNYRKCIKDVTAKRVT